MYCKIRLRGVERDTIIAAKKMPKYAGQLWRLAVEKHTAQVSN
jgi:hypothetical protein